MFEPTIGSRTRVLAVIFGGLIAILLSASMPADAQIVNQSLIRLLSPAPVEVANSGEPELMAAISGRIVVISSDKTPGLVSTIDFRRSILTRRVTTYTPPAVTVLDRESGAFQHYDGSGQDTQIVRLADGRFLMSAQGSALVNGGANQSAQVMWRSSDGTTWDAATALGSGKVAAPDKSGVSQMGYCSFSPPGVGGFDRPELYAYPFSNPGEPLAFMTTWCSRKNSDGTTDDEPVVLFTSKDGGKTWGDSTIRLPRGTPAAMSASPKHLFIAQCDGEQGDRVMLSVSDDLGKTLRSWSPWPVVNPQLDITYKNNPCSLGHDPGTHGNKFSLSVARTNDPNIVLVAYPTLETITSLPKQKRAVIQVVAVNIVNATVKAEMTVKASSPTGSILHFSLIEDPRTTAAQNLSMLYWIETDGANPPLPPRPWRADMKLPATAFKASAKYLLLAGKNTYTEPAVLSTAPWDIKYPQILANGFPEVPCLKPKPGQQWPYCAEQWAGDYMKGGSAVFLNSVDFAAAWAQCTAAGCKHYVQVVSVDTSSTLFSGLPVDTKVDWSPGVPTKAPKYDPTIKGPQLEPPRIKLENKVIKP